jgi:hypothetical protein
MQSTSELYPTPSTEINSNCVKDLNVTAKTKNLLEGNKNETSRH